MQYSPIDWVTYPRMVSDCEGGGALSYVSYVLDVCWLLRNMAVDLVLALRAIAQLTNINWKAVENHE